jgi:hypothetical protein
MHYRSVVVVGTARELSDPDEKATALAALSDHLVPGRPAEVRASLDVELRQTRVFALTLDEASAKVGDGWPEDADDDVAGDSWAGIVPLVSTYGPPSPAPDLRAGIAVPPSVIRLSGSDGG